MSVVERMYIHLWSNLWYDAEYINLLQSPSIRVKPDLCLRNCLISTYCENPVYGASVARVFTRQSWSNILAWSVSTLCPMKSGFQARNNLWYLTVLNLWQTLQVVVPTPHKRFWSTHSAECFLLNMDLWLEATPSCFKLLDPLVSSEKRQRR